MNFKCTHQFDNTWMMQFRGIGPLKSIFPCKLHYGLYKGIDEDVTFHLTYNIETIASKLREL